MTYHFFNLQKTLVSTSMKHSPWIHNIKLLCCIMFCCAELEKILSFLPTNASNKLAVSLILSSLDYCSSLLADIPDNKRNKLQRIQNHATRLVLRKPRHANATSLPRTLHWLPVKDKIQYKTACLFLCEFIRTVCHHIFLSFFIHTICPGRCAFLTPLC